jgi:uncharacterized membrane protein YphA (DoxX/SURF4 family)
MRKTIILEIISFLFILLFMYAAVTKLLDYEKFTVQIGQSPVLTAFSGWVAWMIPSVEILVSLALAIPCFRLIGLYAAFSLMVMFTAYIISILNFSDYIPCSCGGILEKLGWKEHLVFNVGFVLLGIVGIILHSKIDHNKSETSNNMINA